MTDDEPQEGRYTPKDLKQMGEKWLARIRAAEKREDSWIKDAEKAEAAYVCDNSTGEEIPDFNILHSNVETIVPSIYNSTPVPDIRPRHNNIDPAAKQVSDVFERVIRAQIDDNRLDSEIEKGAQDAFMAGRDVVRVKFDADVIDQPVVDPMTGQPAVDENGEPITQQAVTNERLIYEVVSWRDYRQGPAKKWSEVPWVAYRHCVSHEDLESLTDDDLHELGKDPKKESEDDDEDVYLWEIWCKTTKRVYLVIDQTGKVLSVKEDPYELSGFFPQHEPVQPITATGSTKPVCPYTIYCKLAEELDVITGRIREIVKGIKVKGAFAGDAAEIERLADADDNELVALGNIENLIAAGGLEKAVMWWPNQQSAQVLKELYVQREQVKQTIYEITGISDIIRGQGAASETATAQQIKTQWGSLRIKKLQRLVERQVRALFVISAELISRHFSPQALHRASGIQITPDMQAFVGKPLDHYRIDIESDSTVRADATRNRQEMSEFLQGTAQFFSSMAPIVQQAPEIAGSVVDIYSSFARQFSLGKQAEDALDAMVEMAKKAASQPRPNPEAEAAKQEMQMKMQELQLKSQEAQGRLQEGQNKMQIELAKAQAQLQGLTLQKEIKGADLVLKQMDIAQKGKQMELDEAQAMIDAELRSRELDIQENQPQVTQ